MDVLVWGLKRSKFVNIFLISITSGVLLWMQLQNVFISAGFSFLVFLGFYFLIRPPKAIREREKILKENEKIRAGIRKQIREREKIKKRVQERKKRSKRKPPFLTFGDVFLGNKER
jgi:hypothetical protein